MIYIEYVNDCKKIQGALLQNNWEATLAECQELWRWRCGQEDGTWFIIPESVGVIYDQIEIYCQECPIWKNRFNP